MVSLFLSNNNIHFLSEGREDISLRTGTWLKETNENLETINHNNMDLLRNKQETKTGVNIIETKRYDEITRLILETI